MFPKGKLEKSHSIISVSAGPNSKKAFQSLPFDAYALGKKPRILLALRDLSDAFGCSQIYATLREEISFLGTCYLFKDPKFILGKLSFLLEPAGKVRVVAILDG